MNIKRYKTFLGNKIDKARIKIQCIRLGLKNYTINDDGTVDVNDSVYLSGSSFKKFPIQFGSVYGNFTCGYSKLETLEGSPRYITGSFDCTHGNLSTLEYAPQYVGSFFECSSNKLINISGIGNVDGLIIFNYNENFYDPIGLTDRNRYYLFDTPLFFLLKKLRNYFRYPLCPGTGTKKHSEPWDLDKFIELNQTYGLIEDFKIHKHKLVDICVEFKALTSGDTFDKLIKDIEEIGYELI